MILTKRQLDRLHTLITDVHNTAFECGEWEGADSDESYDTVHARSNKADKRLLDYVGKLLGYERPLSEIE